MPGRLKVRVVAGRELPVMDRATDLTDAFVEVKFGNEVQKTDVCKKSLNPQWNSDWFVFEVEDEVLQDEPLELRAFDHDTYSSHDVIGKVYIDLNPLLMKDGPSFISGWFPIYDTMHGIRGELNVIVKVQLFSDFNRFRQSSCGVQFFCTAEVPCGFKLQFIHGFVEELVVNDDPEYKWIDKIRTPRSSNEARQRIFSKLSGELQRKIGLKILEMGGNSVIGYIQNFDLEGESGIVVRGIGTSVTLCKIHQAPSSPVGVSPLKDSPLPEDTIAPSSPTASQNLRSSTSPMKVSMPTSLNRRSSDSDISTPPKGSSLTESSGSGGAVPTGQGSGSKSVYPKSCSQQLNIDLMEFPFFTMISFPPGFLVHIGGVVSARSVKLLDKIHNPEEPETRDAWWTEIRTEVRSHARAMGCHAVIGYTEKTSICEEVIILSGIGTAAKVNLNLDQSLTVSPYRPSLQLLNASIEHQLPSKDIGDKDRKLFVDVNLANQLSVQRITNMDICDDGDRHYNCSVCHIPYKAASAPFPVNLSQCAICKRKSLPDILFTTIDPPSEIQTYGRGAFIQARICRSKADNKGEANAKEISDNLPFMEYELHNQLMNKLKIKGMNGLFGLNIQISVGETKLVGVATATAALLAPLPIPSLPRVLGQVSSSEERTHLVDLQKKLSDKMLQNKEIYDLHVTDPSNQPSPRSLTTDESEDELDLDLSTGNKEAFVLEVDDTKDESIKSMLLDSHPPPGIQVCNTKTMPGTPASNFSFNIQMFTQVWRREVMFDQQMKEDFTEIFECLLRKLYFKLRKMTPCCLCGLTFNVEVPDEDEIQITVSGVCVGVQDRVNTSTMDISVANKSLLKPISSEGDDMMFQMEEVSEQTAGTAVTKVDGQGNRREYSLMSNTRTISGAKIQKLESHRRNISNVGSGALKPQRGVELTPLFYVPGRKIGRHLGSYNFFFIRESTSLREVGGLCGFMHNFITEVLAIVRAHVASLGGNALVAYKMTECVLLSNPNKNQSQCLINVCGDAVSLQNEGDITTAIPDQFQRKHSDSPLILIPATNAVPP
ncbi:hypothetical protein CHS0354_030177 [Potamilus streckersoni]|uniref:C2 domain-containing protein n=1 Tax=Potamilus streckersoni TaxID=2493646 RepID=A0AAE0STA0_9BIVA|nr:hypothetical protein CHS0354_030177 [Potamilus streckersoni]